MTKKFLLNTVVLVIAMSAHARFDTPEETPTYRPWAEARQVVNQRNKKHAEQVRQVLSKDGMTANSEGVNGRTCEVFVKQTRYAAAPLFDRAKAVMSIDVNRDRLKQALSDLTNTNGLDAKRAAQTRELIESSVEISQMNQFAAQFSPCADAKLKKVDSDKDAALLIQSISAVLTRIETQIEMQRGSVR